MVLRLVNWNVEWATPGSRKTVDVQRLCPPKWSGKMSI